MGGGLGGERGTRLAVPGGDGADGGKDQGGLAEPGGRGKRPTEF